MRVPGLFFALFGLLLIAGEYLCVETAMRCFDYNPIYITLGAIAIGCGLIAVVLSSDYD